MRLSVAVCVPLALANWLLFSLSTMWADLEPRDLQFQSPLAWLALWANLLGIALLLAVLWRFGLEILEALAAAIKQLFAREVDWPAWFAELYAGLRPLPLFTLPAAALWGAWLVLFYFFDHPGGYATDVAFQVAAHALGACVYLPIFYRWRVLTKASSHDPQISG